MKVFVEPVPASLSLAMWRVAKALKSYVPEGIEITTNASDADLQVLHVIGLDSMDVLKAPRYAVIQYCLYSANGDHSAWNSIWNDSVLNWSYYDLRAPRFYRSPLGADETFVSYHANGHRRDVGVVTSGYVSGPGAEAIEDVAIAASLAGLTTTHLGPRPVGMTQYPRGWTLKFGIDDNQLSDLYGSARWVSGLRHVEGFELPCVEGLMCGARPIVFDRPDMRRWYDGHAVFVPESSGASLVKELLHVLQFEPEPVSREESEEVRAKFDWSRIVSGFWSGVLANA